MVQPAVQGAVHARRRILRRLAGQPPQPFVYRDLGNMAIVGRGSAVADLGWLRLTGVVGWLAWLFLHLREADWLPQPAGGADRLGGRVLTYQRSARLITSDRGRADPM